jgi:site-specific DNA-methyltransferase (adenine-specific)
MFCAIRTCFAKLGPRPTPSQISTLAKVLQIPSERLSELLHAGRRPLENEILALARHLEVSSEAVRLVFGAIDGALAEALALQASEIATRLGVVREQILDKENLVPTFSTSLGSLYQADCLDVLKQIQSNSVDLVFADPPFNLDKFYRSKIDDDLRESEYLNWCESWIDECCRVLKSGGSMFIWNLPKWSTHISGMLNARLSFRHWISVDIKYSLPISKRLYPSHYGLLYYTKSGGAPTFHPDRLPMLACPKCGADLRDYGGYKSKMNPAGISLADVWYDISPVRHSKYKKRKEANELPLKLMDRIIEMASDPGDLVFDPFGGAGTTFAVAEIKGRRWIGVELGPSEQIEERLSDLSEEREYLGSIRLGYNKLFLDQMYLLRKSRGLWTCDDFHGESSNRSALDGNLF